MRHSVGRMARIISGSSGCRTAVHIAKEGIFCDLPRAEKRQAGSQARSHLNIDRDNPIDPRLLLWRAASLDTHSTQCRSGV